MMKIHTTQNLELFNNKSTNNKARKEQSQTYSYASRVSLENSFMLSPDSSVAFKGKKPKNVKNAKKIIDLAKKGLEALDVDD